MIVAGKRIESATVLWTAGVAPSPILSMLGVETDHAGRVCVGPFSDVPDKPGIFVVGDAAAATRGGRPLPGVAQVAIQQGRYVGRFISAVLDCHPKSRPFRYFDKGNMAVVGKNFAILESGRIRLTGFPTFWLWALIHVSDVSSSAAKPPAGLGAMAVDILHRTARRATHSRGPAERLRAAPWGVRILRRQSPHRAGVAASWRSRAIPAAARDIGRSSP